MAAGQGFKTFATGDVLTAADTNGYLMQGIWVFANAAARDAAVTSPQEGNACYLKDTDAVQTYSGSAWVAVGGASGGMTLLSTTTMSGVTTTVSSISGSYTDLIIEIAGAAGTGGSADQNFKFFMNGSTTGSTITTAAYASSTITNRWTALYLDGNTPTNVTISGGANAWYIRIPDYASTTNRKSFDFNGTYNDSTVIMGTGSSYSTAAITSIGAGFVTASANAGTIKVWGIK